MDSDKRSAKAPRPRGPAPDKSRGPRSEAPPDQQPLTDEEAAPKKPSRLRRVLLRAAAAALLALALAFAYLFLLLGEPEEEDRQVASSGGEVISMPMSALEAPGETNLQHLADTFGQPVMALYDGLSMQRARVFDTAFGGGYARRVTLTYAFEDGALLTVESIRPASAITLLKGNYRLNASSLYTLGGLDAARMDGGGQICIFGQNDAAAYAVLCPSQHEDDLSGLLRQTTLISPETPAEE